MKITSKLTMYMLCIVIFLAASISIFLAGKNLYKKHTTTDSSIIPVVFNVNDKYVKYLSVAMTSILKNTDKNLHFYVLNNGISEQNKQKLLELQQMKPFEIDFIELDMEKLSPIPRGILRTWDPVTNLRLLISSALPNLDKCILLDADLVVISDIDELWKIDVSDYYIAAVIDPIEYKRGSIWVDKLSIPPEYHYINTGVAVINLKKWRKDKVEQKFLDNATKYAHILKFPDQDLLNITLYSRVKYLKPRYNAMPPEIYYNNEQLSQSRMNPLIIHWASTNKPWMEKHVFLKPLFYKYAKFSPFYSELIAKPE